MSERPTPETDAEHAQFAMGGFTLDFCRKLERERDRAREDATNYYAKIGELKQERDEAQQPRDFASLFGSGRPEDWEGFEETLERWRNEGREMSDWHIPQIIELTDGIKCVSLEDYKKLQQERDEAREDLDEETKFHHRTHSELVQTQCQLMDVRQAIIATLEENRHLADGDDCTLAKLKSVVPEWR